MHRYAGRNTQNEHEVESGWKINTIFSEKIMKAAKKYTAKPSP